MENHRDEHIDCADCGASFLFSGAEAAVFEERGLAAPKRCKDCRRARKDRNQADGASARGPRGPRNGPGQSWNGAGNGGPRPGGGGRPRMGQGGPRAGDGQRGAPRYGTPRYTGDVNEYRSPMQDGGWQAQQNNGYRAPSGGNGWQQPRPPRRGGPGVYRHDGEYRAPSGNIDGVSGYGRQQQDRPRRAAPGNGNGNEAGPRRRPQGETFSIKCDSCGTQAEVPFKPAEGREVFCQPCYRARKPPV